MSKNDEKCIPYFFHYTPCMINKLCKLPYLGQVFSSDLFYYNNNFNDSRRRAALLKRDAMADDGSMHDDATTAVANQSAVPCDIRRILFFVCVLHDKDLSFD